MGYPVKTARHGTAYRGYKYQPLGNTAQFTAKALSTVLLASFPSYIYYSNSKLQPKIVRSQPYMMASRSDFWSNFPELE